MNKICITVRELFWDIDDNNIIRLHIKVINNITWAKTVTETKIKLSFWRIAIIQVTNGVLMEYRSTNYISDSKNNPNRKCINLDRDPVDWNLLLTWIKFLGERFRHEWEVIMTLWGSSLFLLSLNCFQKHLNCNAFQRANMIGHSTVIL